MRTSPSTSLTWLHISDIHLRETTAWAQDVVLSRLVQDVADRYNNSAPDLVFVTGDIAFSGQPTEYLLAEDFLRKVCSTLSVDTSRLFVIPGNHDIDRDLEEDAFIGARTGLVSATDVDRFFENAGRRKTLFARQAAFRAFANRLAVGTPLYTDASYYHCRIVHVGAIRVRVLLLDSSWLSEGGEKDASQLLVGERQVLDVANINSPDGDTLTFALMHHPFSWLRDFEQVAIENEVVAVADVCLRGHVHVPDRRATETPLGRMAVFTAGAAFETRTSENTYLWCSLDLATGGGTKVTHRYLHQEKCWQPSEAQAWALLTSAPPADVNRAYSLVSNLCRRYPNYVACLLAGISSDVPLSMGPSAFFVSVTAELPGVANELGNLVLRLCYHVHWRSVWVTSLWQLAFAKMIESLVAALEQCTALVPDLEQRELSSKHLIAMFVPNRSVLTSLQDEINAMLVEGDLPRARAVLDRWRSQDFLSADEAKAALRLHVKVLLKEDQPSAAMLGADELINSHRLAEDVALAAICAHQSGDYQRAALLMHEAIDAGVNVDEIRTSAFTIAGAAGDSLLVSKVRT